MIKRTLLFTMAAAALAVGACSGTGASPSASAGTSPAASAASPGASTGASPAGSPAGSPGGSGAPGASVTVTGVEYAFQGVPGNLAAGTSLTLVNGGKELHELVLVRKNAGTTQSFEELLALPEEEAMNLVTVVGAVMANPGATAEASVVADQPGDYALICFIPQGTTALPSAGASLPVGPPHFTLGMLQTVTVQ